MAGEIKGIGTVLVVGIACLFGEMIVAGLSIEIIHWFKPVHEGGTILLNIPVLLVGWIASKSQDETEDGKSLTLRIFVFATILCIVVLIGYWLPILAWLAAFGFVYGKKFLAGWHYLFVRHPTEPIVTPALRSGDAIDHKALAKALRKEMDDEGFKPVFHYKNLAEKARQMREKLDADAEIAEATIRRERARAALLDAEREVEEAKRRTRDKQ